MNTIKINDVVIGEGKPKICVPIVAKSIEDLVIQAEKLKGMPFDIVEIRIDYFEQCLQNESVKNYITKLREFIGKVPVLFTFRSYSEGGEAEITKKQYEDMLMNIVSTGLIDILDIELFTGDEIVKRIISKAHRCGVSVIMSNHDFDKTPVQFEIISRLVRMQSLGADIAKIAVMPNSLDDVIILLGATNSFNNQFGDIPAITMSMGKLGMISRLSGEIFNSCITFGSAGKPSAPGQIDASDLDTILSLIHKNNI